MKKIIIMFIFIIFLSAGNIFSQGLNISPLDIDTIVESLKDGNSINTNTYYLWTGSITNINQKSDESEVVITKSKWIDKNTLISYKIILKVKDEKILEKIKNIGLNQKIIIIVQIVGIKDKIIPVCIPLLLREI